MTKERLHKIIASTGLISRRKAEEAIVDGRVKLNGELITELGTKADPLSDTITLDDQPLPKKTENLTVAFNKPKNVITSKYDPQDRPIVMEYFPEELQHLNPVGRLDFETEGLLLLSSDGELINKVTHPRFEIPKIYQVWIKNQAEESELFQLKDGIELEDGEGHFDEIIFKTEDENGFLYEVFVSEGRNRFIRRMWEAVEHPVLKLKRIQIGNLRLWGLRPGQHRILTESDLDLISKDLVKK